MKLLVIDPNVTSGSPSMRAWMAAFPVFRDLFDRIEIWAIHCDITEDAVVSWRRFQTPFQGRVQGLLFRQQVEAELKKRGRFDDELVQITGFAGEAVDIRFMHFSHWLLTEAIKERGLARQFSWKQRLWSWLEGKREIATLRRHGATQEWWSVSRRLGEILKKTDVNRGELRLLPNQYEPERFNHFMRRELREAARKHYGFSKEEVVLVFSAFGHFERKGLMQAIEALSLLRQRHANARLLVLGGSEDHRGVFQERLCRQEIDQEGVVWAGLVEKMEWHLSAADALFFPSHFEAFSLAEIESAALGLRLYLTPHYGAEMIVRDGVNGQMLPWDVKGMAEVLSDEITSGRIFENHDEMGEALSSFDYAARVRSHFEAVIQRKRAGKREENS